MKGRGYHALRHSCGTRLYEGTRDLPVLQRHLRNPLTSRIYAHLRMGTTGGPWPSWRPTEPAALGSGRDETRLPALRSRMGQVAVIRMIETGVMARLSVDGWTCEDQALQDRLNVEFPLQRMGGDDPNPIANTALRASQWLLAEVVHVPETEPTRPGVVYG